MRKVKVASRDILLTRPRIVAIILSELEFHENNNDFAKKNPICT